MLGPALTFVLLRVLLDPPPIALLRPFHNIPADDHCWPVMQDFSPILYHHPFRLESLFPVPERHLINHVHAPLAPWGGTVSTFLHPSHPQNNRGR